MNLASVDTPSAAFLAGIVTSLHCSAMCGPLSCSLLAPTGGGAEIPWRATAIYHASRVFAYAMIGAILGAVGQSAGALFTFPLARWLPWIFAALFLVFAFRLEALIPTSRWLGGAVTRAVAIGRGEMGASGMAAMLGLVTPFLPCAPLYLVFGVALFSGSWLAGLGLMACFGLGTIPIYALLQSQLFRWQGRWSPAAMQWTRQGLALLAAVMLIWRAVSNHGAGLEQTACPFCH
jgi:hypothetical protein